MSAVIGDCLDIWFYPDQFLVQKDCLFLLHYPQSKIPNITKGDIF